MLAEDYKQFIIMEFIETDLKVLIGQLQLSEHQAKLMLYQMLQGLYALHSKMIFHRDLKPSNILVQNGSVKIADFGLAKPLGAPIDRTHTREVQTLWYKAPEILLGNYKYGPPVDIFSLGCIFYEMVSRVPLFHGSYEIEQLLYIFQLMGTPLDWRAFKQMPFYSSKFPQFPPRWQDLPKLSAQGKAFLKEMLSIDPCERISAKDALRHPYFDDINN